MSKSSKTGGLVILLALAIFINYVDRGNLSTAAPLMKDELKLSNTQFGLLLSAFFWIYVPGQVIAAWAVQRFNAYRTLALGLVMWSAATFLTGLASGFAALMGLRLILGLGESAGFPASSKLLAQHLPAERLGLANALIMSGLYLGPAVGTLLGGLLIAHAGWRPLFLVFGAVSLLWLVPWMIRTRALSAAATKDPMAIEPSFAEILSKRQLWGAGIGHFCANYALYMVISWLPLYLVKMQGFSLTVMSELGFGVYSLSAATAMSAGLWADRRMRAGASSHQMRMPMVCISAALVCACMLVCTVGDKRLVIAGLLGSGLAFGIGGFNLYAIGQTLAGPRAAGKWIGVQNALGNTAGIVQPIVTGMIIDRTGAFSLAFLAAMVTALIGLAAWLILVRRIEPLSWSLAEAEAPAPNLASNVP